MIQKLIYLVPLCLAYLAEAQSRRAERVDMQLARIKRTQQESGVRLENNLDFHKFIMENSRNEMPIRLERFWSNLNRQNIERRLYAMYTWSVGRSEANRDDFVQWLDNLATWYEEYVKT